MKLRKIYDWSRVLDKAQIFTLDCVLKLVQIIKNERLMNRFNEFRWSPYIW